MGTKPTSVTVLGILGIVFAVLGVCGSASMFLLNVVHFGPSTPMLAAVQSPTLYRGVTIVTLIIGFVLTLLLLFASIGSHKLWPWARRGMILYSWCAIVLQVFGLIFNVIYVYPKMFDAIPTSAPAGYRGGMIGGSIGGGCGILLSTIFPICVLYYFSRPKVIDAFNGIFPPEASFPLVYSKASDSPPPSDPIP